MTSKVEQNKLEKERLLYRAAYELFSDKGIHETSISAIAKKAGVGKGTFYLYFKDKYDVFERIVMKKSSDILNQAYQATSNVTFPRFEEEVIFFTNEIIDQLKSDHLLLKLIHKNLSWALLKRAVYDYDDVAAIYEMFHRGFADSNLSKEEISFRLYMIVELTGSITYNAVILKEPDSLDVIKPLLLENIKKMIME